jgi:hypothetical protein
VSEHRFVLGRQRYIGGLLLSERLDWSIEEQLAVLRFVREAAPIELVSLALGRSESAIVHKALTLVSGRFIPAEWKAAAKPTRA